MTDRFINEGMAWLVWACCWVAVGVAWGRRQSGCRAHSGFRAHSRFRAHSGLRAHYGFRQTLTLRADHALHVCPEDAPLVTPVSPSLGTSFVFVAQVVKMGDIKRWSKCRGLCSQGIVRMFICYVNVYMRQLQLLGQHIALAAELRHKLILHHKFTQCNAFCTPAFHATKYRVLVGWG